MLIKNKSSTQHLLGLPSAHKSSQRSSAHRRTKEEEPPLAEIDEIGPIQLRLMTIKKKLVTKNLSQSMSNLDTIKEN